MLFTTISLVTALAGMATASLPPLTNGSYAEIGPLPYAELKTQVAAMKASDTLTKRTTTLGVYLCDGLDFSGNCYYGTYPIGDAIYPSSYWVSRLQSAGPDEYSNDGQGGGVLSDCEFFGDVCESGYETILEYPGGNLGVGVEDQMGCFFCD